MPATIHLVRHAQGIHNLCVENHKYVDPDLTDLGHEQCAKLKAAFPHHDKVSYIIASPLRRTLYTALESFTPLDSSSPLAQAPAAKPKMLVTPLIQEVSTNPCDYGSPLSKLQPEFSPEKLAGLGLGGVGIDFSRVAEHPDWLDKGPGKRWAPNMTRLRSRAGEARRWFRELAGGAGEGEGHIVVVTHGGFLHFLTEDWQGLGRCYGTGWDNTEYRTYQFADPTGQDPEAHLKETEESWRRRKGIEIPLTETEQMEMAAVITEVLKTEFSEFHEEEHGCEK